MADILPYQFLTFCFIPFIVTGFFPTHITGFGPSQFTLSKAKSVDSFNFNVCPFKSGVKQIIFCKHTNESEGLGFYKGTVINKGKCKWRVRLLNNFQDISFAKIALIVLVTWAVIVAARRLLPYLADRGPSQTRLWLLGAVPIVGDVYDVFLKSNLKNVRLLIEHVEREIDP